MTPFAIRTFERADEAAVIALWHECGLTRPWNDPRRDIERKLAEQPELFLVGVVGEQLVATAMAGYDGHRGSLYYLGVAPGWRKRAYARSMIREAERLLELRGCPKLNVLVRSGNAGVIGFYRKLGYMQDEAIGLGRRLLED